jgi:hypothetical protein
MSDEYSTGNLSIHCINHIIIVIVIIIIIIIIIVVVVD